jgi:D-beta-D-heptose 7-phosphate kinase/D-beta-D-heptose 1-phosphate adenosyltransferase
MYVLITGGFDPIHSGHLNAIISAATIGKVVLGLNSDSWLVKKKGSFLLPYEERRIVASNLTCVHSVLSEWDDRDGSACNAIKDFHTRYKTKGVPLFFANGGDRIPEGANSKEFELCISLGIYTLFGVGGSKTASSSTFISNFIDATTKK